jgi:DNA modification methylase
LASYVIDQGVFPDDYWKFATGSFDLIVTDPPYNIGYDGYDEYDDNKSVGEYAAWTRQWVWKCANLLTPNGSIAVVIGDNYAAEMKLLLDQAGLTMRNWIIWHYTFGQHCSKKFGRDHAHILYYVKNPKRFTFNADAVKIESERQRLGDKRAAPGGRVPGDVWSIPRLVGNAKERLDHPCQLPESLVERLVLALSNPGDYVFDPFGGSGTVPAVAYRNGRNAVAMDLSENYCDLMRQRLSRITPLGESKCQPSPTPTTLLNGSGGAASG